MTVTPRCGQPGTTFSFAGGGFQPGELVGVYATRPDGSVNVPAASLVDPASKRFVSPAAARICKGLAADGIVGPATLVGGGAASEHNRQTKMSASSRKKATVFADQ